MEQEAILQRLRSLANPKAIDGMARYGIAVERAYGVSIPNLREVAKETGTSHKLAQQLWDLKGRETRILASMIEDPALVTEEQMERWAQGFDCWEICDECCINLFEKTPFAYEKCFEWSSRDEEFVKRAGFVLMARMAVSDKKAADGRFEAMFPIITREAGDDRVMVKKAVNWALRQIGKRNLALNARAIETAREIQTLPAKSAKWVASDALRELTSDAVQARLRR